MGTINLVFVFRLSFENRGYEGGVKKRSVQSLLFLASTSLRYITCELFEQQDQILNMADAENSSTENSENNVDNSFMLPPSLPINPSEKSKKRSTGIKEKPTSSQKKETIPELPYKVPSWSGIPDDLYSVEVLKNGCIISNIDLTSKPFYVFGRLPSCDISLEHPSVSRYHAVIQYKQSDSSNSERGFYIYDLGSTHGTTVNKSPLEPKRYYRLRVGYVFKIGGSSRLFILQVGTLHLSCRYDNLASNKVISYHCEKVMKLTFWA